MQAEAFGIMAQQPGLDRQQFARLHLGQMADMGLDRIGRAALRPVIGIQPDMDQEGVGRIPQHLEIAEFGHVAVVIDPAAGDAG